MEFAPECTEVPGALTLTFPSGVALTETPGACTETFPFSSTFTEPTGVVTETGESVPLLEFVEESFEDCAGKLDCSGSA